MIGLVADPTSQWYEFARVSRYRAVNRSRIRDVGRDHDDHCPGIEQRDWGFQQLL